MSKGITVTYATDIPQGLHWQIMTTRSQILYSHSVENDYEKVIVQTSEITVYKDKADWEQALRELLASDPGRKDIVASEVKRAEIILTLEIK